jgi:outer membrane scaffolding protein for murein synthesis (MipA/OmpV family)
VTTPVLAKLCTASVIAIAAQAAQAQMGSPDAQTWKLDVSVGAIKGTQSFFKGVLLNSRTDPLVIIDAAKGRWIASTVNGLGYLLVDEPKLSVGVSANYMLGRSTVYETRYKGMGDVGGTIGAYGFVEWRPIKDAVTVYGNVLKSTRAQSGTLATVGATVALPVTAQLSGFVDWYASWADSRYSQAYYGVNAAQAATSGYAAYEAKSGLLSSTPSVGASYAVNKQLDLIAYVGKTRLSGSAANSPMVQNRSQPVAALFAVYKF